MNKKETSFSKIDLKEFNAPKAEFSRIWGNLMWRVINLATPEEQVIKHWGELRNDTFYPETSHDWGKNPKSDRKVLNDWYDSAREGVEENLFGDFTSFYGYHSAKERSVFFEVDEKTTKSFFHNNEVSPKILGLDFKKRFFHLSDSYIFDFGEFSFILSYLNSEASSKDGYKYYLEGMKDEFKTYLNHKLKYLNSTKYRASLLRRAKMEGKLNSKGQTLAHYKRFLANLKKINEITDKAFSVMDGRLLFQAGLKDSNGRTKWRTMKLSKEHLERLSDCESIEEAVENLPESKHDFDCTEMLGSLIKCLQVLEFSHQREIVTNNAAFTENMKRAANDLPRIEETATYKELTADKVIHLPRKAFLSYIKSDSKGNHTVKKAGHDRASHTRTYTSDRYTNMKGKTVVIKRCEVNGGALKDRKIVYKPKLKQLVDFIKSLVNLG